MAALKSIFWLLSHLFLSVLAASFPPKPEGVTVIDSKRFPGRSISYKETHICETTDGVRSFSGYVNLPANVSEGRPSPIHTYFWYFQAREDPENAPLAMWLQGGPGVPSITAAVGENGPCVIMDESTTTELNPWSWNQKVSMLYIDQPVQVGFSYNSLVNGTLNELPIPFIFEPADFSTTGVPETNLTYLTGTFAMPDLAAAPNTTIAAAPAMWDLMQIWMQEFPEHPGSTDKLSIWGESYGGHYVPVYANYFEEQNDRIAAGELDTQAVQIHIDTIGLLNACIDSDTQTPIYPEFAFNNTYGIKAINQTQYDAAIAATEQCKNLSGACRKLASEQDPRGLGNNPDVNDACLEAYLYCFANMHDEFDETRNFFDIAAPAAPESFPAKWPAGYLNRADIQQALGVPLNFTGNSMVISSTFNLTGDFIRGDGLANLGTLLNKGVKIAMVYGDRDYQCNWLGGEAISLAINSTFAAEFASAGYVDVQTNASYVGGLVRQYGSLSFTRVYEAGHEVPYYQPETAQQIFNRAMFNQDVARGKVAASSDYATTGPSSAWTPSEMPPHEDPARCYVWDIFETCTREEMQILGNGSAITENFILVGSTRSDGTQVFFNGSSNRLTGSGSGQQSAASVTRMCGLAGAAMVAVVTFANAT